MDIFGRNRNKHGNKIRVDCLYTMNLGELPAHGNVYLSEIKHMVHVLPKVVPTKCGVSPQKHLNGSPFCTY